MAKKTLRISEWALATIHVRPNQKRRFEKIFEQLKKSGDIIHMSDLFEVMLENFEQVRMGEHEQK